MAEPPKSPKAESDSKADSKSDAKSIIDQVSTNVTKALFPLSGGATVYFLFLDKDITKAGLAFLLTAVSGTVSGLAKTYFKPIGEVIRQRIERSGKSAGRAIDQRIDRGQDGKWEKAYLNALKTHCEALEVEGFRGDLPSLPLKEIFVPLGLDADPARRLGSKFDIRRTVWELLPRDHAQEKPSPIAIWHKATPTSPIDSIRQKICCPCCCGCGIFTRIFDRKLTQRYRV
jgi:hypothetical protein